MFISRVVQGKLYLKCDVTPITQPSYHNVAPYLSGNIRLSHDYECPYCTAAFCVHAFVDTMVKLPAYKWIFVHKLLTKIVCH